MTHEEVIAHLQKTLDTVDRYIKIYGIPKQAVSYWEGYRDSTIAAINNLSLSDASVKTANSTSKYSNRLTKRRSDLLQQSTHLLRLINDEYYRRNTVYGHDDATSEAFREQYTELTNMIVSISCIGSSQES